MSLLSIYPESGPDDSPAIRDPGRIAAELQEIGVLFERWTAAQRFDPGASQDEIIGAYGASVERLKNLYAFQSADVISMQPDHPQKTEFRERFLNEHTHDEFEVRFFVEGRGLFYLHPDKRVFMVLCEQGDLLSVPAGVKHWFDMGEHPELKCIRLFTNPEGWVANFTGDDIAGRFPTLNTYLAENK